MMNNQYEAGICGRTYTLATLAIFDTSNHFSTGRDLGLGAPNDPGHVPSPLRSPRLDTGHISMTFLTAHQGFPLPIAGDFGDVG